MNVEQIKNLISEQKHKTTVINNAGVEWENLKSLLNYILNVTNKNTDEFKEACILAVSLCDDMGVSLQQIKQNLAAE
jgi:copper homeostasis protein CutC